MCCSSICANATSNFVANFIKICRLMKPLYRNLFLLFGLVSIGFMLYSFGTDFADWQTSLLNAGFYLPAVVGCWAVVYAFNARAYQEIVNCVSPDKRLSYLHAYKLTVSGFAFSYTTPFGFGGAPYRVMELSRYIGTPPKPKGVV